MIGYPKKYCPILKEWLAVIILLMGQLGYMFAQQEPMLNQYIFNGIFLNPAFAGSHPYLNSTVIRRDQWLSFPGAPKTNFFTLDGALLKRKTGLALIVVNDKIGSSSQNDFYGNYSYYIPIGTGKLALGMKAGLSHYNVRFSELKVWDSGDNSFITDRVTGLVPKVGTGAYYYSEKFFLGFSVPALLAFKSLAGNLDQTAPYRAQKHYYLTGGMVFGINQTVTIKPSFLLKYANAAPWQADLNLQSCFNNSIWFGVSYRSGYALVFLAEYQLLAKLRIGYGYDLPLNSISRYLGSTHELMLSYDFLHESIRTVNPRYF